MIRSHLIPACCLVSAQLLVGQSPTTPLPVSVDVVVESKIIQIPDIPADVVTARSNYTKAQREILATMADLEHDLNQLCVETTEDSPNLLDGISIQRDACPEARALIGMLNNDGIQKVGIPLCRWWGDWQVELLRVANSEIKDSASLLANWPGITYVPRFLCPIVFNQQNGSYCRVKLQDNGEILDLKLRNPLSQDRGYYGLGRIPYHKHSQLASAVKQVSAAYAPVLQQYWHSLQNELDTAALKWLELERTLLPTKDRNQSALRRLIRFQFLERYRSVTWLCYNIWAHMASEDLPPPVPEKK